MFTASWTRPKEATARSESGWRAGSCHSTPIRDAPEDGTDASNVGRPSSRAELMSAGLSCARKPESKCARISCGDQGRSATVRRNQVSCLPTGASGAVLEASREGETAVAAGPGPVLPGELLHPAAAANTTLSPAYPIGLAAFLQASHPVRPPGKPPAETTRRRLRGWMRIPTESER